MGSDDTQEELLAATSSNAPPPQVTWVKLARPKNWKPKVGGELIGYYLGQTLRNGKYGQYKVVTVQVPGEPTGHAYMVSGTTLIQALDAAEVRQGQLVRILFNGYKELEQRDGDLEVRKMKLYDVFVAAEHLPRSEVMRLVEQHDLD